jgi:hypothetical protein
MLGYCLFLPILILPTRLLNSIFLSHACLETTLAVGRKMEANLLELHPKKSHTGHANPQICFFTEQGMVESPCAIAYVRRW